VRISSFYHTLFGKAFGIFLGVVGVCCAVFAIALSFKLDLDRQYRELSRLGEHQAELQSRLFVTSDLLVDLLLPHRDGGPDDATVLEWRDHLEDLIEFEKEGPDRLSIAGKHLSFQQLRRESDGMCSGARKH
jgi:hypothetical protein